ncbi:hypothetical protein [Xanthomonas arboricola]|uniref:Nucleotide modification associated domain-containing protein n=1 Tax=Xanthomonas arboricola TaxID=56448 RepID=A0AAU9HLL2_9XANT|nr:hypothetical protein [Xanthomonas arboricola]CAE6687026.1 hypothetical protein XA1314C_00740 [Xanthomonas arboricola]CAE6687038.1 hypothetical protein XA1314C_00740 [Xanthomonas arboricola]
MRAFIYKVKRDYGFAPNPFGGFCTLATCKPGIRKGAAVGDLVFGIGVANRLPDHLIFAMKVSEKMGFQDYWQDSRFSSKKPDFLGSLKHAVGDNIYHKEDDCWVQEDSHHSWEKGILNDANLRRDTSADHVLISDDYIYFGENPFLIPAELRRIFKPGRNYKCNFSDKDLDALEGLFQSFNSRGLQGFPADFAKVYR